MLKLYVEKRGGGFCPIFPNSRRFAETSKYLVKYQQVRAKAVTMCPEYAGDCDILVKLLSWMKSSYNGPRICRGLRL